MPLIVTNRQLLQQLLELQSKVDAIMTAQDDINAADAQIESAVADLGTQDAAHTGRAGAVARHHPGAARPGVDTSQLVADTAALLQAQGANDSVVAALTAAAAPPAS